jgi:DMSO/TMAO reductase YedYZ molybdopterin-dependent catalytic subunit
VKCFSLLRKRGAIMQTLSLSRGRRFRSGLLAGLLAGLIASGLMLLLSLIAGGISLPEVLGSALTQAMPLSVFDFLHRLIGADAKYYFFYVILVGQCLVFALIGGLCNLAVASPRLARLRNVQGQLVWPFPLLLAAVLWLLTGLVLLPLTGAGIFGAQLTLGVINTMVSLALVGLAFALLFVVFQNWLVARQLRSQATADVNTVIEADRMRRSMLRRGVVFIGVSTLGLLAWRFISNGLGSVETKAPVKNLLQQYKRKIVPPPKPNYGDFSPVPKLSSEITSNTQFYVVSKNLFADPYVNIAAWKLQVYGAVEKPYTLTYEQLLKQPLKKQYESLMCISNEVGGPYMGNALWEGIPLMDLLTQAGVKKGAMKVVFHASDDYTDSIHLTKALEPTTMVALRMNGETLPAGHGFPARLLVPGIYGMKHVKWIKAIEVVNTDFMGYWQQRGWSDPAPVRMTARIDTPLNGTSLKSGQSTFIAGVAFSGNKGISAVDVSLDGSKTWLPALLKRPLSDLTWVLWEVPWQPERGSYMIIARAVDMQGNVQDPTPAPPLPDGSSGYHSISVFVN